MLRISPSKADAAQVKKYYVKHSSPEAYYSEGQDFNGIWGGRGAERLGLAGSLQENAFSRLCDNLHPLTGEQLTARMKANRRVGYDVNFHVPKSVTLAYMWSKDERIIRVIRQAAHETMLDMQEKACARVRKNGHSDGDRLTGELTWAEFLHLTARPVDCIPDPHVHVHCYVFNATFDEAENEWKALQFCPVMEKADDYQTAFHARLSTKLKGLGVEIASNDFAFEVAGVERELNDKFSRRTKLILAEAARRGVTDPAQRDKLGALTREKKVEELTIPQLEPSWWSRLSPEDIRALDVIKAKLQESRAKEVALKQEKAPASSKELGTQAKVSLNRATWPVESPKATVEPSKADLKAVRFAVEHLFERMSVVTENQLVTEAFKSWCYGQATLEGVREAVREWPLIRIERDGETVITTKEVLAEENRIVEQCQAGRGRYGVLNADWRIEDARLNGQQREGVLHVLGSRDFVTGISGKAGTGKTTLLHEAKRGIEAGGGKLRVFAPTAEAARETLRNQGFVDAETVAKLLSSEALQEQARGAVWWVDEAGLLSSRSMDKLLHLAEKLGARVVLVGDTGQHHAVERGQAFDLLKKFGEMAVAEVDQVQRQKGAYKTAVELISEKQFEAGFEVLQEMGAMREIKLEAERQRTIAADYAAALETGKSAQVVSPTHDEGRSITQAIRHELKERDVMGEGEKWQVLRNLSWTSAQKRDARKYEPGLVVQVNRPLEGFAIGEQLEIVEVGADKVSVRGFGGEEKALPLARPEDFNVFERDAIEVCRGERLRITGNGRSADRHRLNSGNFYTVRDFTPEGEIILNNGWRLGKDCAHLDYGYVTTSHVAQSKTVDWIFVAQSAARSAGATDAKQFYVSVSRGREGVTVYTDNLEILRDNVARVRERPMAMEVMQEERKKAADEKPERASQVAPEPKASRALGAVSGGKEATKAPMKEISRAAGEPEITQETAPESKASRELGETAGEPETLQSLIAEIASAVAEREKEKVPEKAREREQAQAVVPTIAREPEREVVMEM